MIRQDRPLNLISIKKFQLFFIDLKKNFAGCTIDKFYNRNVDIVIDSSLLNVNNPSNIIIVNLKKVSNNYDMEIHQKYTGAYGHVEFKRKRGAYIISKFLIGYF